MSNPTAAMLVIGDEILSGRTRDSNMHYLAGELTRIGIRLAEVRVVFRDLSDAEIEAYLQAEKPYDCAGSAKSEGLGIVLLESIDNDDPTALVGLPLIRTARLLRQAGIKLL